MNRRPILTVATGLVALWAAMAVAYTRPGGQVDVGADAPDLVCPAEPGRSSCAITNLDADDRLFCGSNSVTATTGGIVVMPGATRFIDRDIDATPKTTASAAIYCISNGNGARAAWDSVVR